MELKPRHRARSSDCKASREDLLALVAKHADPGRIGEGELLPGAVAIRALGLDAGAPRLASAYHRLWRLQELGLLRPALSPTRDVLRTTSITAVVASRYSFS